MLANLRPCDATDPKDHVYELLGLYREFFPVSHVIPLALLLDYSRPVGDIFADATKYGIQDSQRLSVLREVSHRSTKELHNEIPSWVPRWDRTWDPDWDPEGLDSPIFKVSKDSVVLSKLLESGESRVLSVSGFMIDSIENVSEIFTASLEQTPINSSNSSTTSNQSSRIRRRKGLDLATRPSPPQTSPGIKPIENTVQKAILP